MFCFLKREVSSSSFCCDSLRFSSDVQSSDRLNSMGATRTWSFNASLISVSLLYIWGKMAWISETWIYRWSILNVGVVTGPLMGFILFICELYDNSRQIVQQLLLPNCENSELSEAEHYVQNLNSLPTTSISDTIMSLLLLMYYFHICTIF